jgi:triacylglycerol esterase/lipase EstA (alpha/beta hydrolase family)
VIVAAGALLAATSLASTAQASTHLPVNYDFLAGATATALTPTTPPPGANNFSCKPTAAHPYPVVLVNGTFANMDDNWQAASPILYNHGYCVFAFNYGGTSATSPIQGIGDIAASAGTLSSFVSEVLADTGASKVDLVGHSQGGMMPRYYINDLGGAAKVNMLVGFAPSNYGTNLDGVVNLIGDLGLLGLTTAVLSATCQACVEQLQGSSFLTGLNASPTAAGVTYVVIETDDDEVVTPYTNAFLPAGPNVQNITLQNQCPQDASDHLSIPYDSNALQDMLNALGPDAPGFQPTCAAVGAIFGNV